MTLASRDQQAIWHPFTQHQMVSEPLSITRGEGAYLMDAAGNRYLDLISSWWVNLHGHAHPDIAKAIYEQALKLEHVIFSNLTHEPAVLLAEKLISLLPSGFSKVFYSDNGSTAIEVALKMAYQYWRNQNKPRKQRFIAFEKGYHGDTVGAMSVGKASGFFSSFENLFFTVDMFPYPTTSMTEKNNTEKENAILEKLKNHLENVSEETAAILIEPLVQGAGGMQMCRVEFLQALQKLANAYDVLLIYDEVMTGFGRTGHYFAAEKSNTVPDIICLAKGLTGGFLPLSVTACHEKIYHAFLGNTFDYALAHGHSFTANPLGCAAALASLKLLSDPYTQSQIALIERVHQKKLMDVMHQLDVDQPRYCGTIAAFNLKTTSSYGSMKSIELRQQFLKQGLLVRPLGNAIYFLPPYCITEIELQQAYDIVIKGIQGVMA